MKIILEKNITKNENTKETGKKNHVRKNYINPQCFVRKNLYLLVIAILNQLNILKNKIDINNYRKKT